MRSRSFPVVTSTYYYSYCVIFTLLWITTFVDINFAFVPKLTAQNYNRQQQQQQQQLPKNDVVRSHTISRVTNVCCWMSTPRSIPNSSTKRNGKHYLLANTTTSYDEDTTGSYDSNYNDDNNVNKDGLDEWQRILDLIGNPYQSTGLFPVDNHQTRHSSNATMNGTINNNNSLWIQFMQTLHHMSIESNIFIDPFWEQIKLEAEAALRLEPQAGPQLYQGILSQPNLLSSICTIIAHEIETELIPATAIKNLFLELLTIQDEHDIRYDLQAVATRSPSVVNAMDAILFHNGFHALVCYRVGHRLWLAGRTGLAYYMQSVVSRTYSADIHPACTLGCGTYVRAGAGVVIGETAVVGNDVSILEGVTLGGTGKEKGNRHPKVHDGVIIYDGGTVLGNIIIGEGSIITAKSIVTKPVPPLAIVRGVPARIQGYRNMTNDIGSLLQDPLHEHLIDKYLDRWQHLSVAETTTTEPSRTATGGNTTTTTSGGDTLKI
jgi:serine O-acetyltransferase